MSFYGKGTFRSGYELQGYKYDAQIGCAHEFAVPREGQGNGVAHEKMAQLIAEDDWLASLPWILNKYTANVLEDYRSDVAITRYDGLSTNYTGKGGGTQGEILFTKREMFNRFGRIVPSLHMGHARHIPRIVQQAKHHGLQPATIEGYPDGFEPDSQQPQCRNVFLWAAHELVGVPYLHLTGQF